MTQEAAARVAVIDIGKTNTKVAVVDMGCLAEIAVRTRPNVVAGSGPYPHYDIDGIWSFILDSLSALNREAPIDAITVTTHGATCALLNGHGELALAVLDYEHGGPDSLAAEYEAIRPRFAETGSPRLPLGLNLAAQIFWQARCFPTAFAEVTTILMYPQYWSFRLTGVATNEITSLGCHTDLWNLAARDYSSLVDRLGWRPLFAPLRMASDCMGGISPEIAARTGLRAGTQAYSGIHDSNASLFPHLLSRPPPFAVVSTGTWVVAMAVGGAATRLDPERDTLIGVNALGDAVPSARFMGGREYDILTRGLEANATDADVAAVLAHAVRHLPSIQSGSGPFPHRKAEWRCAEAATPGQCLVAASFYLALMTATCLELIGADGPIVTEGPFAGNAFYLRMLAAATGRTVLANMSRGTGTSLGAALLTSAATSLPAAGEERKITNTAPSWTAYAARWRSEAGQGTA